MMPTSEARLLDAATEASLVTGHEARAIASLAARQGVPLLQAMASLDTVPASAVLALVEKVSRYPTVDLDSWMFDGLVSSWVTRVQCEELGFVPLGLDHDGVHLLVAAVEPESLMRRDAIQAQLPRWSLRWRRCEPAALSHALVRVFPDRTRLQDLIDSADIDAIGIVDQLLLDAVTHNASDIHLQPEAGFARLRMRVDGVMEAVALVSPRQYSALCVRLKVMAELDVADSRAIQDGRFSAGLAGSKHRFRVSILPTDHGEAIVIRVLLSHRRAPTLSALGLAEGEHRSLLALLERQSGLLLMVGPTGSGKTTTLHALLEKLRSPSRTILTLEDPVEYTAPWLRQTSLNRDTDLQYAEGVRAAMRQDPDILLIGEIRDPDSAGMAFRAAMTGHRVLSTVHATSAPAALPRLLELGVSAPMLASQLTALVAQRLMRRLCDHCKPADALPVLEGVGCTACAGRGYHGRFAVVEVLSVTDDLREAIEQHASSRQLTGIGRQQGYIPLAERAWAAVQRGLTSVAEYRRVVGVEPSGGTGD